MVFPFISAERFAVSAEHMHKVTEYFRTSGMLTMLSSARSIEFWTSW